MGLTCMAKKVLVTGGFGQLGRSLRKSVSEHDQSDYHYSFIDVEDLDLSSSDEIKSYFAEHRFDVLVNCAAYTQVDLAETQEKKAKDLNSKAVEELAKVSKRHGMLMVHISTDYVFDGNNNRPYDELNETSPLSVYGKTKLLGEEAMRKIKPSGCIIRTSWLYSEFGQNFVKTMLRLGEERDELGVVVDQFGSPTYAADLAKAIIQIVENSEKNAVLDECPIYHFSDDGVGTWFDLAKAVFEYKGISCHVKPIMTAEFPTPASRPQFSVMNNERIRRDFDLRIPYWRDSLKACLAEL